MVYEIQSDSFQRVKKEEADKINAKYSRGLLGDVLQSFERK